MDKIRANVKVKNIGAYVQTMKAVLDRWAERAKVKTEDLTVTITVEKPFRPRTVGVGSQNHCLNGFIQQICMETGQDFASTKTYIKQKAIEMGYPILKQKTVRGEEDVTDWWGNPVGISEADASIEECSLLIDSAVMVASELGITLNMGD